MRNFLNLFILIFLVTINTGCAVNRATGGTTPGVDLINIHSYYVVKADKDGRGINEIISNKLISMGYKATTGPEDEIPEGIDAKVTYIDRWMWDFTMYMLELTINIDDAKTDYPLASGNSYHTSLSRKSPEDMVDEVLTNIFNKENL